MAFDEKKFVGTDALSELSTKVKTELDKKTDKAGALTNVSYDTTNKKFTKTTQGAHDPVTTDIVTTSTLKNDMGIADFDGTFNSLKSKPTTISGYGITDAKVQNSTVTIGSNSVTALTQEDVSSTYDSSGTSPVDGKAIAAALGTLDVASVGGAGKYISAISETDGKISATAETMDSTPTQSSTNPVTSAGIYTDQVRQDALEAKDRAALIEVENKGAKNDFDIENLIKSAISENATYSLSGYSLTASSNGRYARVSIPYKFKAGTTVFSSVVSEYSKSGGTMYIRFATQSSSVGQITSEIEITGNGQYQREITVNADTDGFVIYYMNGSPDTYVNSAVFTNNMICAAAEWDISHTYIPYGKTNAELTTLEQQDRNGLLPVINKGSKNLLYSYKDTAISTDGIAVTYNADGSYTFVCTSVAENRIISLGQIVSVSSDTYTISGSTGGSSTTYMLGLYNTSSSAVKYQHTNVSEDYTGDVSGFTLRVRVIAGYSGTFTVYPMICTKGEYQIDPTFSEYRKDNEQLTADTDYLINTGVKNLLHFDAIGSGVSVYGKTYTHNGITYTLNADMTVTATGTADSANNSYAYLILDGSIAPIDDYADGKHIISGCPTNGSTSKYRMYLVRSGWGSLSETGRGAIIPDKGNYGGILIACFVSKGYAIPVGEPLVFKPMIRKATILDPTYELFSKTNADLTAEADYAVNTGVKNLLNLSGITPTVPSGLTLTDNNDGTFSVSGTLANANSIAFPIDAISGNLILSGCPSGGGESSYMLRLTKSGTAVSASTDTGSGSQIFSMDGTGYALGIRFAAGTYTNVTFKPMIRSAAISDTSYQPYARTNPALTAEMDYVVNAGAKNIFDIQAAATEQRTTTVLNPDGGIRISCNAAIWATRNVIAEIPAGDYICSLFVDAVMIGGGTFAFFVNQSNDKSTWTELDRQTPITSIGRIDMPISVSQKYLRISTNINNSNTSATNSATIRLMLRPAEITNQTYEPYALPNPTLTPAVIKTVDEGAKNLLNANGSFYRDTNGWVTGSGARSGIDCNIPAGDYYLTITVDGQIASGAIAQLQVLYVDDTVESIRNLVNLVSNSSSSAQMQLSKNVIKANVYFTGTPATIKNIMICTKADWKISHAFQPYRLPYQEISDTVQALKKVHHYGFIIDKNNSDSYTAVSYTHGAVGFSPAYMDYTNNKFVYGSWADAWFIRDAVPVALNFDGTEAFELDKSDFAKKADGTASGIDCISMVLTDSQPSDWSTNWKWYYTKSGDYYVAITAASAPTWAENTYYKAVSALDVNFMLRMPKVYFKRYNDSGHNYIEISDRQLDSDFHAYAHIDANGVEKDYIYLPLFKGSMINGKLRSVPNVWPKNSTTAQQEIDAAAALGTGWQIWDHSSRELINDLLILISKSLDCQTTFGRGRESGYVDNPNQNYGLLKTGSLMDKDMFYGYSSSDKEVKVFGMESFWANRWDRVLGLILLNNSWKIKMQPPYNLTADGYTTPSGASVPSGNGYFKSVHSSEYGSVPDAGGGEASKYYRDYFYKNTSGTRVALVGGYCGGGAGVGFRYAAVSDGASGSGWHIGASPVYK